MIVGDHFLTFSWCLKAYSCDFKPKKEFHTTKLTRIDILHLIVGKLEKNSKLPLAAILDFCRLRRNMTHGDI